MKKNNRLFRIIVYNLIFVIEYLIIFYHRYNLKELNEITISIINFKLLLSWLVTLLTIFLYEFLYRYITKKDIKAISIICLLSIEIFSFIFLLVIFFKDFNIGIVKTQNILLKFLTELGLWKIFLKRTLLSFF